MTFKKKLLSFDILFSFVPQIYNKTSETNRKKTIKIIEKDVFKYGTRQ